MTIFQHPAHSRPAHLTLLALALLTFNAAAETPQTRYHADIKLCADETSPQARLQCRRDARLLYDNALKAASQGTTAPALQAACTDCGHVTAVTVQERGGQSDAAGVIAGGLAGAVLGHQIGGGFGKDLSTIAGAAGGAYAGKKIQENMNRSSVWSVSVRYTNGRSATFEFTQDPGLQVGDAVRNAGNSVVRN